ncbi:saccharopine dehydrogenase family protein [Gracilimonas mengyeensis]|uniref:Saccharopine dehydrogenase (NAD+, L-lysine forming) n=1 Tax=Gracilimonas mengyeensis TaxID=1302730 RepID=A0A521FCF3_9BACT|nr:saccharopine dehydrogenase NADP-binding domain-containing protein [Gracilimonas mengyeensis]SMO93839.1 saccharopine dehydrogenase (NAD+, L-lysine forming) [Gracilimonas mengyeensis]
MSAFSILILGGYGNVSRYLCDFILQHTDVSIIISGRNPCKAEAFKKELSNKHSASRIDTREVDASQTNSLVEAFKGADFIINSASTLEHTSNIIEALLITKKNYYDLLTSSPQKLKQLKDAEKTFIKNDQCIITDGGFHPGIPLAMVKYASKEFDVLHQANVGSLLNIDWKFEKSSQDTIDEFIREMKDYDPTAYADGRWQKLGYRSAKHFDFGEPFGRKTCVPMKLEEMTYAPFLYPSLQETGFYIAGFNWFTDFVVMPLLFLGINMFPQKRLNRLTSLFRWSLKKFNRQPYKIILQLEAKGVKESHPKNYRLMISHNDGYALTAISATAYLFQYLDGTIGEAGLHFQANMVNPDRFIEDLNSLGCTIDEKQL